MTKTQIEVITSVQRRRRWSRAEKERIVAAALEPGAVASEIAREAGIHTSQLFRWRQQVCKRTPVPAALLKTRRPLNVIDGSARFAKFNRARGNSRLQSGGSCACAGDGSATIAGASRHGRD